VDESLKRRLTGAVVLVFIAVVFIPAVLDGPDGTPATTQVGLELPQSGATGPDVEEHRFTLPGAGDPEQDPAPSDAVPEQQVVGRDAATPEGSTSVAIEAWAVQVGSFASRDNADRLAERLVGSGFSAFIVQLEEGDRRLYRVRVGPEQDRRRAEVLAERLAGEVEVTPKVVQHP
jgi:DedD protein